MLYTLTVMYLFSLGIVLFLVLLIFRSFLLRLIIITLYLLCSLIWGFVVARLAESESEKLHEARQRLHEVLVKILGITA